MPIQEMVVSEDCLFKGQVWKETDMVCDIGAFDFLVELIEINIWIIEFCVLEMQVGEIVEENLLQFGFLGRIAFHQRADTSGVLGPLVMLVLCVGRGGWLSVRNKSREGLRDVQVCRCLGR